MFRRPKLDENFRVVEGEKLGCARQWWRWEKYLKGYFLKSGNLSKSRNIDKGLASF